MLATLVTQHNSDVELVEEPVSGRGLRAKKSFEPGDLILTEKPLLHTAHPIAQTLDFSGGSGSRANLPLDWQRLLHLYAYLKRTPSSAASASSTGSASAEDVYPSPSLLDFAVSELSTAGVTSEQSQAVDPERLPDYQEAARQWVKRYKESRKNSKKKSAAKRRKLNTTSDDHRHPAGDESSTVEWSPSVEEIEQLIAILETNSHSRNEDDQQDLCNPLQPPPSRPSKSRTKKSSVEEDDETDDKDEACGLWLIASMVNHSCHPNCAIHIPASRSLHGPPPLHLRCIRPIHPGEELTISYHDEEFMPTDDRRASLASRGFTCQCPLCSGAIRDYARAAACPKCQGGISSPSLFEGTMVWKCDLCEANLDDQQVNAVINAEEEWLAQWPTIIDVISSGRKPNLKSQPFRILSGVARTAHSPNARPSTMLAILSGTNLGIEPLHACHGHFYSLFKWALFEQSVWLRTHLGFDGIVGVLFTMAAMIERNLGSEPASEERRAISYWVAKEAHDVLQGGKKLGDDERERWIGVRDEGLARWREGMRVLYGSFAQ